MSDQVDTATLVKNYEDQTGVVHDQLSATHVKSEWTFKTEELQQMAKLYRIKLLAESAIDSELNNHVLARIGVQGSPLVKILYDVTLGRFTIWTPKEMKKPQKTALPK